MVLFTLHSSLCVSYKENILILECIQLQDICCKTGLTTIKSHVLGFF